MDGLILTMESSAPWPGQEAVVKKINSVLDYCIPDDTPLEQQAVVVMKYLAAHPTTCDDRDIVQVDYALQAAWPCPPAGK